MITNPCSNPDAGFPTKLQWCDELSMDVPDEPGCNLSVKLIDTHTIIETLQQ